MHKLALTVAHYFASDEPTDEEAKENSDKRSSGKLNLHLYVCVCIGSARPLNEVNRERGVLATDEVQSFIKSNGSVLS